MTMQVIKAWPLSDMASMELQFNEQGERYQIVISDPSGDEVRLRLGEECDNLAMHLDSASTERDLHWGEYLDHKAKVKAAREKATGRLIQLVGSYVNVITGKPSWRGRLIMVNQHVFQVRDIETDETVEFWSTDVTVDECDLYVIDNEASIVA